MSSLSYRICTRCIMDTSDPDIVFDEDGVCNHCTGYHRDQATLPRNLPDVADRLKAHADQIRRDGRNKPYDCVIGLSGGIDSSYVAHYVCVELGLRPIAVHMDNGWNSELATRNIEVLVNRLSIDLETIVLDWTEFRALQLAFLKASTPDAEIPTDHAITACLYQVAGKYGLKHIIMGNNFTTERIAVPAWSQGHSDWLYIKSVNDQHGTGRLRRFPHRSALGEFYYRVVNRVHLFRLLDYLEFDKAAAEDLIKEHYDWREYGGKHYESIYTKFFQGYLLTRKFGFDKRRANFSSLICAGQMSRDEALRRLQLPAIDEDELPELLDFVAKKFGLSRDGLDEIVAAPPRRFDDYPSYQNSGTYKRFREIYRAVFEPFVARGQSVAR